MDCKELNTTEVTYCTHTHTWTAAHQAFLSITNSRGLLKFMSIESVTPSNHLILCCPLLLLPSIFPSMRAFSNQSAHLVAKILEFQHQSFQWIFRVDFLQDWFDLLAVQGNLKSPPAPQFKNNYSALSLLYGSTLTYVHDYWKNQFWLVFFAKPSLCWQNDVSAF